ncbi:MAG: pyridoxamine 5'-phosphate oxidase family protein [Syntrophus sp. (in: bacteria)]|nr:pyridoxamine 5'-phosphate oxidase family protein [Syntrophus sp. (in: bacteria)]
MDLKAYFDQTEGTGILATADSAGKVDAAIYSRPHILEDGQIAFITADRLTHQNLQSNPHAVYLFIEAGQTWKGKRLYLLKTSEESDPDKIESLSRRKYRQDSESNKARKRFLVYFSLDKELPLVGVNEEP